MKKLIAIIMLSALLVPAFAFATTPTIIGEGYYDDFSIVPFSFSDVTSTRDTAAVSKGDNDQNWYVTINGESNVSTANIVGFRPRKANSSQTMVGGYYKLREQVQGRDYDYYPNMVSKGTSLFLRLKKDSASTTSATLHVAGKFCP